jgi:hypothetical protein
MVGITLLHRLALVKLAIPLLRPARRCYPAPTRRQRHDKERLVSPERLRELAVRNDPAWEELTPEQREWAAERVDWLARLLWKVAKREQTEEERRKC